MQPSIFLASDRRHLEFLAKRIEALSPQETRVFMAYVMGKGLMRSSWWLHLGVRLIRWRHKKLPASAWGLLFLKLHRTGYDSIIKDMRDQTIDHMVNGQDTTTVTAVGGFSQEELDWIVIFLARAQNAMPVGGAASDR